MTDKKIARAAILAHCVQEFDQMERSRICSTQKMDYDGAERLADFCSQISGKEVDASEFLGSSDKHINDSIDHYEAWKDYASLLDIDAVRAMCKRVYYDNRYAFVRMKCDMDYTYFMDSVCEWMMGFIDEKMLSERLYDISIFKGGRTKPTNRRILAKTMIKLSWLYDEVVKKRKGRKLRKINIRRK